MNIIDKLLKSSEPSIRYKIRINVLGEDPDSPAIKSLQQQIKKSPRVQSLLAGHNEDGVILDSNIYQKWFGIHWILMHLAELNYPPGDETLLPIHDKVYDAWLDKRFFNTFVVKNPKPGKKNYKKGVPLINGKFRRCVSQQGLALWSSIKLGFMDERTHKLAKLILGWQWPDGGWNCDWRPEAKNASFYESLIPLRALWLYGNSFKDNTYLEAAERASGIFLKRHLFKRCSDGRIINDDFIRLHYPIYFLYDILAVLKVLAECRMTKDPRVNEALDILESKRLPDGGFPAEGFYYKTGKSNKQSRVECVSWGIRKKGQMNEWITADALFVLKSFGRI